MAGAFSLANKSLKLDSSTDIESHIAPLKTPNSIKSIDLSGNTFGVGASQALAPLLSSQKDTLESIDLHDIFTSRLLEEIPPALDALLTALLECPNLHTIDLSDNAFGLNTKDPLVKFLAKHTPLQHLILNNNGMGPIAGSAIGAALQTLAEAKEKAREDGKEAPHLQSIVCGRNRLENGSMEAWAKAYQAHAVGMKSVKMTQNGIRPEGISHLLTVGLKTCKALEVLDMQDNTFTTKGATALAQVIGEWKGFKELGVGDDLLGARGAVKVFEELGKGGNKEVEVLRLQFNDIDPKGVQALLKSLKDGLPNVRRIELNGNKFDEEDPSIEAISELLSERKEENGKDGDPEDYWGLDELDELEGEDSDEEDEEAEEDEDEKEEVLKGADEEEEENVAQKKDKEVDDLAEAFEKKVEL